MGELEDGGFVIESYGAPQVVNGLRPSLRWFPHGRGVPTGRRWRPAGVRHEGEGDGVDGCYISGSEHGMAGRIGPLAAVPPAQDILLAVFVPAGRYQWSLLICAVMVATKVGAVRIHSVDRRDVSSRDTNPNI